MQMLGRTFALVLLLLISAAVCYAENETVISLKKELNSPDYQTRWDALARVAKLHESAAEFAPAIIEHLSDSRDLYRTIQTLGEIGPPAEAAIPKLSVILDEELKNTDRFSKNASLKPCVMTALENIKQTAVTTEVLRKALKHPVSDVRYFAAHTLGKGGAAATPAIPELKALLNDHERPHLYMYPYGDDVAASSALALKSLGN